MGLSADAYLAGKGRRPLSATIVHTEESLEEAARFAPNFAFPDDRFFDNCKTVVTICIGNPEWKSALDKALANPRAMAARVVAEDDPPPNKSLELALDR
jgi:hypothetical protein